MKEHPALRLIAILSPRAAEWLREKCVFGPLTRDNLVYDPNDAPAANRDWQPRSHNSWLADIVGLAVVLSANVLAFCAVIVACGIFVVQAIRDKLKKKAIPPAA